MILDSLANAHRYAGLGASIAASLEFLKRPQTASLEPRAIGTTNSLRVDIQGQDVFALVQRYDTKSSNDAFWESHRQHIDVQCVFEGSELMGCAPLEAMEIVQEYDAIKDYTVLAPLSKDRSVNFIEVGPGMFCIFMPHDAHMPGVSPSSGPSAVKKIVVKVRI